MELTSHLSASGMTLQRRWEELAVGEKKCLVQRGPAHWSPTEPLCTAPTDKLSLTDREILGQEGCYVGMAEFR